MYNDASEITFSQYLLNYANMEFRDWDKIEDEDYKWSYWYKWQDHLKKVRSEYEY